MARALHGAEALYQGFRLKEQFWKLWAGAGAGARFLSPYAWAELEQVGSQEYTDRYLQPCGRVLPVTEIERLVYAHKS